MKKEELEVGVLTPEIKAEIDSMTYEGMLRRWRFAQIGDPMFQGEVGDYFGDLMWKRRDALGPDVHTRTSKRIGWGDKE